MRNTVQVQRANKVSAIVEVIATKTTSTFLLRTIIAAAAAL
jgi:hypothetical protein